MDGLGKFIDAQLTIAIIVKDFELSLKTDDASASTVGQCLSESSDENALELWNDCWTFDSHERAFWSLNVGSLSVLCVFLLHLIAVWVSLSGKLAIHLSTKATSGCCISLWIIFLGVVQWVLITAHA